jgi:hypothetical protein
MPALKYQVMKAGDNNDEILIWIEKWKLSHMV